MMKAIMLCHLVKEDECTSRSYCIQGSPAHLTTVCRIPLFHIVRLDDTVEKKMVTWKMITISLGLLTSTPSCIFSYFHSFLCARIRSYIVSVPCDHQNRRKLGMITKEKKWLMRYCSDYQVKSYFSINLVSYL